MFDFFNKHKKECLVDEEMRQWIENSMLWLENEFGEMSSKNILKPIFEDFPFKYDGSLEPAEKTVEIIAKQMEISPAIIELDIYKEGLTELETGSLTGSRIFLEHDKDAKVSSGLYFGKKRNGKYIIGLEQRNLKEPENIVATLAHEFAHIKLLGENRIIDNNEHLTDLTTLVFGLGIFNANAAFQFKSGFDQWSYSKLGYLRQVEWSYALALYAYMRKEKSPQWIKYLSPTIKADFKRSEIWIYNNIDKLFVKTQDNQ